MSLNRFPLMAGLMLLAFIVQEALVNRIDFFVGGFAFYLAFSIAWIIREDRTTAIIAGFIAGLIADLSPTLEAPFGLWTFVLTGTAFVLANYVRGSFSSGLSPLTLSSLTAVTSTVSLALFVIFGGILGEDIASLSVIIRELFGNALWTFVLAPLYIPVAVAAQKLSLTARDR